MADRIFLCPAMSPDLMIPREMIDAMLAVATIPIEDIAAIAAALEAEPGFLGRVKLCELVQGIVGDKSQTFAVVNTLINLNPHQITSTVGTLEKWRQANSRNAEVFPEQAIERLKQTLPQLIQPYPALIRAQKAQYLGSILGNTVKRINLICDARPVFNSARDSIEGLTPVTTLKIEYEEQNEETHVAEFTLTADAVNEFASEIGKAQQKLRVLGQSISQWITNGLMDPE